MNLDKTINLIRLKGGPGDKEEVGIFGRPSFLIHYAPVSELKEPGQFGIQPFKYIRSPRYVRSRTLPKSRIRVYDFEGPYLPSATD